MPFPPGAAAVGLIAASEKRADAVHSHGTKSKGWISKFWPSEQTLDKVRGASVWLGTDGSCSTTSTWVRSASGICERD